MSTPIRPFRTDTDGRLWLLDQRRLPADEHWFELSTVEETARAIETMAVRGAPALACVAALGLARAARTFPDDPEAYAASFAAGLDRLRRTRPTAVNLFVALDEVAAADRSVPPDDVAARRSAAWGAARDHARRDLESCQAIGAHGAALMPDEGGVVTHCNAGALATAGHGTALGVIRSAVFAGKRLRVYADETRPVLQGARLTAWELARDGIDVTVICEGMAADLMRRGRIHAAIVGADRIVRNGDVANKIGTYALAIACRHHRIPFYVAAPWTTIDLAIPDGSEIPIERRADEEVTHVGPTRIVPEAVGVENPAFDVTPAELVTAIVTDRGVFRPDELDAHASEGSPSPGRTS
ncbi:MAG: S-methyl-5-thioribose-1-phosphate isomerase [Deltaproteobacteria bacterium]|nr:MAG: S-methyl-5-thioribose-1-phosphate isomerase [Deltaproteobacteria bacterium]